MILNNDGTIKEYKKDLIGYKNIFTTSTYYHVPIPMWVSEYLIGCNTSDKKLKENILAYNKGIIDLFVYLYKTDVNNQYKLSMNEISDVSYIDFLRMRKCGNGSVLLTIPQFHNYFNKIINTSVNNFDVIFYNNIEEQNIVYLKLIRRYNT